MAILLGCLTPASGIAAAGNRYTDLSLTELLQIEVFTPSKQQQELRDTPATTMVVTADQIRIRGYRNLVDLLEMLPGFDIQRRSESSRVNDVTMRGQFKHRRFIILQDGVQIDAPADDILAIADNYPLYHAKQVEVVYGPNSALWGTDAFGGVINIITQRGDELQQGEVAALRGSDGFRYDRLLGGSELGDGWSLVAGGHRHATTNPDLAKDYPDYYSPVDALTFGDAVVRPADERERFLTPEESRSLFLRADYGEMLTLGVQHHRMQHHTSTASDPSYALFDDDAIMVTENTTLYGRLEHQLSSRLSSRTLVDYAHREMQPESNFQGVYTDMIAAYKYAKEERLGGEQQFTYEWTEDQTLTFGLVHQEYYAIVRPADSDDRYDPDRSPDDQEIYYLYTDLPVDIYDYDYSNTAGYLQLQSDWSEQLSTTIGVRFDHHSEFGDSWNPRVGLVYHASEKDTWKLLYGEAFRAPSPMETSLVYGAFTDQKNDQGEYISYWMQVPNLDLGPEEMRALEMSYSRFWDRGNLTLAAYYSEVEDIIATVASEEPVQFIPGGEITSTVYPENLDEAVYYGMDVSAGYELVDEIEWGADLWGSYSFVDGEYRRQNTGFDVEPNYIANHKLRLGLTLSLRDRYFITPKLRINGPTNTNVADPDDPSRRIEAPGFAVLDLSVTAAQLFGVNGLSGRFDVYNLFDRRYYSSGGQGLPLFFPENPQAGRTWIAALEYSFDL